MNFAHRLKLERERLGLSQSAFGALGGVKRVSQHLYEQGERYPDVKYLESLLASGVDVQFMLFGLRTPAGGGGVRLEFSPSVLSDIYRVVDDFAKDEFGEPLPLEERVRLFHFLCAALAGSSGSYDVGELRERLIKLAG